VNTIDTLLQRNHEFAAHRFVAGLPMRPALQTIIISCADPRVDPAHLLGLEPGEAVVLRNIGGRITPGVLETMLMLGRIARAEGGIPGGEVHLIVLQHTHCGITHLNEDPDLLASYFDISKEDLLAKEITDPRAAVAVDVAALKATPALPGNWLVSGLVYDTETGLVEVVIPPAPVRP